MMTNEAMGDEDGEVTATMQRRFTSISRPLGLRQLALWPGWRGQIRGSSLMLHMLHRCACAIVHMRCCADGEAAVRALWSSCSWGGLKLVAKAEPSTWELVQGVERPLRFGAAAKWVQGRSCSGIETAAYLKIKVAGGDVTTARQISVVADGFMQQVVVRQGFCSICFALSFFLCSGIEVSEQQQ
jgi:hypothetical protein